MSKKPKPANMYELQGEGIKLVYDRPKGTLDITGDEPLLTREAVETVESAAAEGGIQLAATLLDASRSGHRFLLTVLAPEVSWPGDSIPSDQQVTGVAFVTRSFEHAVGGPPPALQSFDSVWRLEGTASAAK